jgi:hypothetical protein
LDEADTPDLYAVRENGGPIRKIIARGDPIGNFAVDYADIGRQALSGSTLVFLVSYTGFQGNGLYSADLSSINPSP